MSFEDAMNSMLFSRNYETPISDVRISFPTLRFYFGMIGIFRDADKTFKAGRYSAERWIHDSEQVARLLERLGVCLHIDGVENIDFDGPCVFEANHMSTMETMFLPCIIEPRKDVTFVVKKSLLRYPVLGPVLASREPLALGRANPREDLALVLDGGSKILASGRSIIIFTQGSRMPVVEEKDFNSLGVKLARKAKVPVVPIALKTDAWAEGTLIKDLGLIRPQLPVRIRFGKAVTISGPGREEHAQIVRFIKTTWDAWVKSDGCA